MVSTRSRSEFFLRDFPVDWMSAPRSAGFPACGFWRLSSRQLSPTFNRTRSGPIGAEGMKRDSLQTDAPPPPPSPKLLLRESGGTGSLTRRMRLWWNWQTRYFEVVVGQPVQVQVLLSAPTFLKKMVNCPNPAQIPHKIRLNLKVAK